MTPRPDRPPTARKSAARRPGQAGPRGAFTLIELLIVVTIISILLGLSIGVTLSFLTSAREAATRTTLAKIDVELGRRFAALRRQQDRMGVSSPLIQKRRAMEDFPAYMAAAPGPDGTPGTADDVRLFETDDVFNGRVGRAFESNAAARGPFAADGYAEDPTASAEALFVLLSSGSTFGTSDPGGDLLTERELADTDGDGLREVVDGFGNPLRFYRTPTRLLRPSLPAAAGYDGTVPDAVAGAQDGDGRFALTAHAFAEPAGEFATVAQVLLENALPGVEPNPADLFDRDTRVHGDAAPSDAYLPTLGSVLRADPDDPYARVGLDFADPFGNGRSYPAGAGPAAFEKLFHTPTTWYRPIVVSAGADGDLGLFEPQDRTRFGHLAQPREPVATYDNITSLQGGF